MALRQWETKKAAVNTAADVIVNDPKVYSSDGGSSSESFSSLAPTPTASSSGFFSSSTGGMKSLSNLSCLTLPSSLMTSTISLFLPVKVP